MKVSAIICAAGRGSRAQFGKNKLLVPLYGAPALYHTLKKFHMPEIDEVIVASSESDLPEISALCKPFGFTAVVGGDSRTESVRRALGHVTGDIVLIHDGARPYLSRGLILSCIDSVKRYGSGICALPATDTAVYSHLGVICDRLDRSSLLLLQTPQGFLTEDIKAAYKLAGDSVYTDDSAVYGEFIAQPHVLQGEPENIKLTFKQDFLRELPPLPAPCGKTGFGADTHAFGAGSFVTLAGVKIPHCKGLVAHSDGDVICHAVMDALLSAAGLKDIGHYFPDADPSLKGADSGKLLYRTVGILKEKGFAPTNISVSVQAEAPKLKPHIQKMVENLSAFTGVKAENIAVAAGTCEGLGFVGEGLGITAYCVCNIEKE